MPMSNRGLTKLVEECGELVQVAAKMIAYPDTDNHPDGKGSLRARLEEEIADVIAACGFVMVKKRLDVRKIESRRLDKFDTFEDWDRETE